MDSTVPCGLFCYISMNDATTSGFSFASLHGVYMVGSCFENGQDPDQPKFTLILQARVRIELLY